MDILKQIRVSRKLSQAQLYNIYGIGNTSCYELRKKKITKAVYNKYVAIGLTDEEKQALDDLFLAIKTKSYSYKPAKVDLSKDNVKRLGQEAFKSLGDVAKRDLEECRINLQKHFGTYKEKSKIRIKKGNVWEFV